MCSRRFSLQAKRELSVISAHYKEVEGVVSIIRPLLAALITLLGAVAGPVFGQWWTVLLLLWPLVWFAGFVHARSRLPVLRIGPLEADLREGTHQFQLEVQNLGPGSVIPVVKVTKVTNGNGTMLTIGFKAWEPHWRGEPANERPLLEELDRKQAGVLVIDHESKTPWLGTYEIDGTQRVLFPYGNFPLGGIILTVTFGSRGKDGESLTVQTERTYHLWPDCAQPLGVACKRVRRWGFRQVDVPTSNEQALNP